MEGIETRIPALLMGMKYNAGINLLNEHLSVCFCQSWLEQLEFTCLCDSVHVRRLKSVQLNLMDLHELRFYTALRAKSALTAFAWKGQSAISASLLLSVNMATDVCDDLILTVLFVIQMLSCSESN